ncbi:MAG: SH3 domain-containing protein [Cyanobacteria bacterium P01_H01_bin.58]
MMKFFLSGAIAMVGLGAMVGDAEAQTNIPVLLQCPEATWTNGYHIWELIPLDSNDYKSAVVAGDEVLVRSGAGMESSISGSFNRGTRVTVTGEAWDMDCNQWMRIRFRGGSAWVHGDYLILL